MGRLGKALMILAAVIIAGVMSVVVFMLYTSHTQNSYLTYLRLATDAASASNGISVETGSEEWQRLESDSGRKLYYYLTQNPVVALGSGDTKSGESIRLKVGDDMLTITPVKNKPNYAVVRFSVLDEHFRMTVHGDNLWSNLREWTGQNHYAQTAVAP